MHKSVIQLPSAKLHFNKLSKQKVLLKVTKACLKMEADQHLKLIDFSHALKADWKVKFCLLKQTAPSSKKKKTKPAKNSAYLSAVQGKII